VTANFLKKRKEKKKKITRSEERTHTNIVGARAGIAFDGRVLYHSGGRVPFW
jgi:hypothetical protein